MKDEGKADVSHPLWHVVTDAHPASLGAFHPIDSAVILLIQAVRLEGMELHAMWIVAVLRVRNRNEVGTAANVQGLPGRSLVNAFEDAAG
jgi:hypothetical protein